jgi:hypothetical protein
MSRRKPARSANRPATPSRPAAPAPEREGLGALARRHWLTLALLAVFVLLTTSYFEIQHQKDNANTQFDLTRAIVEQGTFQIDAYAENTNDIAVFNGHAYCDKSPVNAFLGVPVLAVYRWLTALPDGQYNVIRAQYAVTCAVTGGSAALLTLLLTLGLIQRGAPPLRAAAAAALWVGATPLLGYSVLFYNYAPACALLMAGFLILAHEWTASGCASAGRLLTAGLLVGLACWTLNTLAFLALAMTAALLGRGWTAKAEGPLRACWRRLWPWALGGVLGVLGNFIYNHHIFGSFFDSPYKHEAFQFFREQMARGLMGATQPRLFVVWLLTFHKFQGLFFWFPVTAMAFAGLWWRLSRRGGAVPGNGARLESLAALLGFAGLLTYVSAYYMWWGAGPTPRVT